MKCNQRPKKTISDRFSERFFFFFEIFQKSKNQKSKIRSKNILQHHDYHQVIFFCLSVCLIIKKWPLSIDQMAEKLKKQII